MHRGRGAADTSGDACAAAGTRHTRHCGMQQKGGRGGGFGGDPPPPPQISELKSSWRQRRRSKTLAVSLKHWNGRRVGGGGSRGGGGTPSPPAVYGRSNASTHGTVGAGRRVHDAKDPSVNPTDHGSASRQAACHPNRRVRSTWTLLGPELQHKPQQLQTATQGLSNRCHCWAVELWSPPPPRLNLHGKPCNAPTGTWAFPLTHPTQTPPMLGPPGPQRVWLGLRNCNRRTDPQSRLRRPRASPGPYSSEQVPMPREVTRPQKAIPPASRRPYCLMNGLGGRAIAPAAGGDQSCGGRSRGPERSATSPLRRPGRPHGHPSLRWCHALCAGPPGGPVPGPRRSNGLPNILHLPPNAHWPLALQTAVGETPTVPSGHLGAHVPPYF